MIDNSEERRELIRIIRNNCDMLIRLIDDIIEASSMGQGSIAIENEEVDFATLFNDVCQALAQRVENPAIEFISDNPYSVFRTRIDKGRLQQVITNFTTNAIKYTQKGHIKVSYRYIAGNELPKHSSNKQDDKRMGIYVYCEDTGSGIPKDKQNSIFERFVKLNDFVQGTGLGLSICKSIADRCKGHIGVTSEGEGKGSTFWIWIPCEQIEAVNNE
jgi:signal transduction histidine kinase